MKKAILIQTDYNRAVLLPEECAEYLPQMRLVDVNGYDLKNLSYSADEVKALLLNPDRIGATVEPSKPPVPEPPIVVAVQDVSTDDMPF